MEEEALHGPHERISIQMNYSYRSFLLCMMYENMVDLSSEMKRIILRKNNINKICISKR
jgi:hypothetical protein